MSPSPLPWGIALHWLFPDECRCLLPAWWLWVISVTKVLLFQRCSPGCSSTSLSWGNGDEGCRGCTHWSHRLPSSSLPATHSFSNLGRVSPWGQAPTAPPIPDLHETSLTLLSYPKAAPIVAFSVHFRYQMINIVFIVFISPLNGLEEDIKLDNSPWVRTSLMRQTGDHLACAMRLARQFVPAPAQATQNGNETIP